MATLHEALEEKYDSLDSGPIAPAPDGAAPVTDTATPASSSAEPAPSTTAEGDRARDEKGRFTATEAPKEGATTQAPKGPVPPAQAIGTATPAVPAPVVTATKPPQSWKPALREKWAALPAEVQAEVLRREREVTTALQGTAKERELAGQFQEQLRPYEAIIRASGMPPAAYVGNVLQTVHALTYSPPQQKVGLLAQLIMQYGGDLLRPDGQNPDGTPSSPLDRALVSMMQGRPMQAPQATMQDPRLDKLLQAMETQAKERTTAAETEASSRTTEFAKSHEFFEDIAPQFADILDVWVKQGKKDVGDEDLEQAYTLACQMNPDVAPIFAQRQAAEAAKQAQAQAAQARTAASSVRSQPAAGAPAQPAGRRAALEAAWDRLAGE